MRQFKPRNKQMQDCIAKLGSILETYGQDIFCDAVQNLLDNHPDTQSLDNYSYQVIMLPTDYNIEAVLKAAELTVK
ncbi:hypothetical protein IQ264_01520 [Phormidium sp. LEGE 05292]|uniref:hypothetical protein n=1 Tax=[Phormidium] sp. LEGE 05292 TaxID=767427 RepID=UPI00187DFE7B|nr:hypothetical protein [Phormidium sp. LEGE 05292]MBE9224152.1 hypothetical protein [Phormidium sp. LEGE 05292]